MVADDHKTFLFKHNNTFLTDANAARKIQADTASGYPVSKQDKSVQYSDCEALRSRAPRFSADSFRPVADPSLVGRIEPRLELTQCLPKELAIVKIGRSKP